jgi:hypothetical protein
MKLLPFSEKYWTLYYVLCFPSLLNSFLLFNNCIPFLFMLWLEIMLWLSFHFFVLKSFPMNLTFFSFQLLLIISDCHMVITFFSGMNFELTLSGIFGMVFSLLLLLFLIKALIPVYCPKFCVIRYSSLLSPF